MRPSLKALRSRISRRARAAAEGGGVPAGSEPQPADQAARPGAIERGAMRRRLRRARRLREAMLTELGALVGGGAVVLGVVGLSETGVLFFDPLWWVSSATPNPTPAPISRTPRAASAAGSRQLGGRR